MFRKNTITIICVLLLFLSGCSVRMATKQPDKKDTELFKNGTPRSLLLAEYGSPILSEVRDDGAKYEIFVFTQGYSKGVKYSRAVLHGTADILTLGIWEVIGTPTESIFTGCEMAYEVRYDEDDKVDHVVLLKKK